MCASRTAVKSPFNHFIWADKDKQTSYEHPAKANKLVDSSEY